MSKINMQHLNDVPDEQLRNRMKHYYMRAKRAEKEHEVTRAELRREKERTQGLELRLSRYFDLAEEILEIEDPLI